MKKDPRKVTRNVHFYQIDIGRNDDGSLVPFDFSGHLDRLDALNFSLVRDGGRRVEELVPGKELCGWVHGSARDGQLMFGAIRKNDLPMIEKSGSLARLPVSSGTGLVEVTHVCFFEDNLIASDFNFHGPRAQALGRYFDSVFGYVGCNLRRLAGETGLKRLLDAKILKSLTYQIKVGDLPTFSNRDDGHTLDETLYTPDDLEPEFNELGVTVTVSQKRRSNSGLPLKIKKLIAAAVPSVHQGTSDLHRLSATIRTEDDRDEHINFFDDVLVVQVVELKEDQESRAVLAETAFPEIRKAFDMKKDEILKSVAITNT